MQSKLMMVFAAGIVASLSFSSLARAQVTKLNVGYSAASADQLPAWVAKDTGLFAKNGDRKSVV